jgi:hypothetical protein
VAIPKVVATGDFLDKGARRKLIFHLKHAAPHLRRSGVGQSRRHEGQLSYDRETRGYESVRIFVQRGLGQKRGTFRAIGNFLLNLQRAGLERGTYFIHLHGFGWPDRTLHEDKKIKVIGADRGVYHVEPIAGDLSTDEDPDNEHIPMFKGAKRDDLLLVVSSGAQLTTSQRAFDLYERLLRKRTIWIRVDGDEATWKWGALDLEVQDDAAE